MLDVTAITSALLALIYAALSGRVIYFRRTRKIGIGYAQDRELRRAIRVHSNFAEYVPLTLFLLLILELNQTTPTFYLIGLAATLVFGRLIHAIGLSRSPGASLGRVFGTALTLTTLLIAAILSLFSALGENA